ncbi:rhamnulokinase [Pseudonocardia acaciae]|uniref:rhamnulokinase n=1 Tax=Pseudonocardia acaciae TaxID=551276 RepID=UPI00048ED317|nr:rhamnulokinase family protein [Pseudonocardia acaciae]
MTSATVAAVDLGGSSGRVMLARIGPGELALSEAHRIWNGVVRVGDTLHWDALGLYRGILDGLRAAGRAAGRLDAVGIDTWGVDYGLLDATGALLGNPVSYRDDRTVGVARAVHERIGADELYAVTGIQELSFNTVYQLAAAEGSPQLTAARTLLMLPDLMAYWLTGEQRAEITVASTTGLLDARTRRWSEPVMRRVGIDPGLFPELSEPGQPAGELTAPLRAETGLAGPLPVITVGSHDTASALVGTPVTAERFGYVSCGTWSLVGLELDRPVLTGASREAKFSNELGVDGTVRYLHNVMGLWLLSESLRTWGGANLEQLLAEAARLPPLAAVIDPDAPEFLPPGDMPSRIAAACARLDQPVPASRAHTVRCILDSLALAYRRTLSRARELADQDIDVVHLVGGGSRNALLCQLTADACERPVLAGPAEAAALGNALMQARALDAAPDSLPGLRRMVATAHQPVHYSPTGDAARWRAAERRLTGATYSAS